MIYPKELHEKFQLSYPELEARKSSFNQKVISIISELSIQHYQLPYTKKDPIERSIDRLLKGSEFDQIIFENNCDYIDIFIEAKENFEEFLYWFSRLLQIHNKLYGLAPTHPLSVIFARLIKMFTNLNFEYELDVDKWKFRRLLTDADAQIINNNIEMSIKLQNEENSKIYKSEVEEFLKISSGDSTKDYYESLVKMKKILERTIGTRLKKNGSSIWLTKVETILNQIFKDTAKSLETQRASLEFIKTKIHHDPEDEKGLITPYKFNKAEYLYWWLEINKLIYLINQV